MKQTFLLCLEGYIITGWWLSHPSEKYESQLGLFNSQYMEKMFQTTNQIIELLIMSLMCCGKWPELAGSTRIIGGLK
jgi:hypothetical protein